MEQWFTSMTPLARGFTVCAIIGGMLFFLRIVLQLFGGDDVDGDASDAEFGAGDTDVSFKFMSLHGITVFLLMFGLIGRAMLQDSGAREGTALAVATIGGVISVWGIAQIYLLMRRLQSSGNVDINNAIGCEGTVYLTIPAGGSGQVQVAYQGKMHIDDAYHEEGTELKTGRKIEVVSVRGGNTLVVRAPTAPATNEEGKDETS